MDMQHITISDLIEKVKSDSFFKSVEGQYSPLPYMDTVAFEQYRRIQTEQAIKFTSRVTINQKKIRENKLYLGTHTRCTCIETGITFGVELPSPINTTMTLLHPFAFYSNVQEFIKQYQKTGVPIAGLQPQVIVGMLITTLKHKGFTTCRDYIAANLRLRNVNKRTLTWALNYFYRAQPRYNLPQINLLVEGNPTTQLIGFVQICRGEDNSIEAHHIVETKKATVKAKVYQTDEAREAASLRNDIKACKAILERIKQENPLISDTLIDTITQRIMKMAVYTDTAKENLIADIIGAFGDNAHTKAIEIIIRENDMTATQKELLSFTMQMEKDIREFNNEKPKKLDFASLMGKVKQ